MLASLLCSTQWCLVFYQFLLVAKSLQACSLKQKGLHMTVGDRPYLVSGADDKMAKVWDYQTKACVQTLEGHSHNVSAVCFHPELPVILTGMTSFLHLPNMLYYSSVIILYFASTKCVQGDCVQATPRQINTPDNHNVSAVCFHPVLPVSLIGIHLFMFQMPSWLLQVCCLHGIEFRLPVDILLPVISNRKVDMLV